MPLSNLKKLINSIQFCFLFPQVVRHFLFWKKKNKKISNNKKKTKSIGENRKQTKYSQKQTAQLLVFVFEAGVQILSILVPVFCIATGVRADSSGFYFHPQYHPINFLECTFSK